MKTEELMIGDLVYIGESDDFHGYIGKVVIINGETEYITVHIPNMHLHDVFVEDIQPIPLTSELLEKNGFNCLDQIASVEPYYWFFFDKETEVKIKAFNTIFKGLLVECVNPVNNATTYKQCEFVHEFQHALRLCEIEKEIVL